MAGRTHWRAKRGLVLAAAMVVPAGAALAQGAPRPSRAAEAYRCVGEQSTGFQADGRRWTKVNFAVDDDVLVVRQVPGEDRFSVAKPNQASTSYFCRRTASRDAKSARIICSGTAQTMVIDVEKLRFEEVISGAYLKGDEPGSVLSITIGSCARLP